MTLLAVMRHVFAAKERLASSNHMTLRASLLDRRRRCGSAPNSSTHNHQLGAPALCLEHRAQSHTTLLLPDIPDKVVHLFRFPHGSCPEIHNQSRSPLLRTRLDTCSATVNMQIRDNREQLEGFIRSIPPSRSRRTTGRRTAIMSSNADLLHINLLNLHRLLI